MSIKFEDGSSMDASDFKRMLSIVKQRAKEGKPKPTELVVDGVTIRVMMLNQARDQNTPISTNINIEVGQSEFGRSRRILCTDVITTRAKIFAIMNVVKVQ